MVRSTALATWLPTAISRLISALENSRTVRLPTVRPPMILSLDHKRDDVGGFDPFFQLHFPRDRGQGKPWTERNVARTGANLLQSAPGGR